MTDKELISYFQSVEDAFNTAVISNNTAKITTCISTDWVLVDAQGGIIPRERFFYVVDQGLLTHTTMTKEILRVKVYNDIALVTGRGKNTGFYDGKPMQADEWVTDIYRKDGDDWVCVLTHLTPVVIS